MAENVDRHLNSVMILEHTFSQRLGNNKQMANISSSQIHSRHLVDGGRTIYFSHLPTAKRFVDGRKTYRWSSTER
jgi:hypothetical protein